MVRVQALACLLGFENLANVGEQNTHGIGVSHHRHYRQIPSANSWHLDPSFACTLLVPILHFKFEFPQNFELMIIWCFVILSFFLIVIIQVQHFKQ
jgi:hypothetical protein